jgi:ketosteroid isomerase-like protein
MSPRPVTASPSPRLLRLLIFLAAAALTGPADILAQSRVADSDSGPASVAVEAKSARPAEEGDCSCEKFDGEERTNGVVWCGTSPSLGFRTLAERAAPILWFSPHEEALNNNHNLPQPINCADLGKPCLMQPNKPADPHDTAPATVYYHIHQVFQTTDLRRHAAYTADSLNLEHVESLKLRYYFYYCHDVGFGDHDHDLEHIELDVRIEKEREGGRYRARVTRVKGAAHGIDWYANRHKVTDETAFPVTILVERGKHASCPDADGDGVYEPGKDVNERVNDAWGVRDGLGERDRIRPTLPFYHRRQTDPRNKREGMIRLGIKDSRRLQCYAKSEKASPPAEPSLNYDLVEFPETCQQEAAKVECSRFAKGLPMACALKKRGIHEAPKRRKPYSKLDEFTLTFYGAEEYDHAWDGFPLSYRYDGGHGFSFILPVKRRELKWLGGGYVVPRVGVTGFGKNGRFFFDGLYTPSASRYLGSYVAAGFERTRDPETNIFQNKFAMEGGIKGRWKKYIPLAGFRIGFRTSSFKRPRIVIEAGGGTF